MDKFKSKFYSKFNKSSYSNGSPEINTSTSASKYQPPYMDQHNTSDQHQPLPPKSHQESASSAVTPYPPRDSAEETKNSSLEDPRFPAHGTPDIRETKPLTDKERELEKSLRVTEQEKNKAETPEERRAYVRQYMRDQRDKSVYMMGAGGNPFQR
ncbi:hypothetical protein EJ04DRAFT_510370 [Polyplosphaeria fusca]|uniref:Uncharacterized protein n=1 Tax=Polyplosphaeria fusca TaxID=682080 RepID=A0A9P4R5C1_9PLEO|nr:hypothetical protein EJ04DRAFT_510370 [Polyplosphaeria fusca]